MLRVCSFLRGVYTIIMKLTKKSYRNMAIIATGTCCVAVITFNSNAFGGAGKNNVVVARYASANEKIEEDEEERDTEAQSQKECYNVVEPFGNSFNIQKGEILHKRLNDFVQFNKQPELTKTEHVTTLNTATESVKEVQPEKLTIQQLAEKNEITLSENDYNILLRIVEAEATGEDYLGKRLVANVVINRVKNSEFPDTVKKVVFEKTNGHVQFSPTADGRFQSVTITEETKEAVYDALCGEDTSQGALFFSARSKADPSNMRWFDRNLKRLFAYGGHEFYTLR